MNAYERITAKGHCNVQSTHQSTLEITTEDWLTPAGDCIVGVAADRSPVDFSSEFISACQDSAATISLEMQVEDHRAKIVGQGDPRLTFENGTSLVCRTSTYVDDRTVMIKAAGAANAIDRSLVRTLQDGAPLEAILRVDSATR